MDLEFPGETTENIGLCETGRPMINALIPVKDFAQAKQRLQSVLSPDERWRLAEAMFADVLDALASTFDPECITVVTRDERAIAMAADRHIPVIRESENRGETEAVALAVETLIERDVQTMLIIPGDIPLITGQDIEKIVEAGCSADVVLVPSRDGRGTNAALLTPPNALPLRFGNESFQPHLAAAEARGLRTTVLRLPRVALDIDTPADVMALASWPVRTRTQAVLEDIEWAARCR